MAEQLTIKKPHLRFEQTDKENCAEKMLRLYRSSPCDATLQLRSYTAKRGVYASVGLSKLECLQLAVTLTAIAAELSGE